jgi:aminoglycoside 6-adenylyltransferase
MSSERQQNVIEQLVHWGEQDPRVRAMILTSSRAIPHAQTDAFSDYDVILALTDIQPFFHDRSWLETFGSVLALFRDPLIPNRGFQRSAYVTQYEDGLKIDFNLWPVELLKQIAAEPQLPTELDAGYRVLLDKDNLTDGLQSPTYRGYIPAPPTEGEYQDKIESFFLDTAYVAKFLWRDDLMAAKYILDHSLKHDHLLPMCEWRIEIDYEWSVKPGPYGRGLKRWLRPDLWAELEQTYTGVDVESNWIALFRSIDLMRRVAVEVGEALGYRYPAELEQRVRNYLQRVKALDRDSPVLRARCY